MRVNPSNEPNLAGTMYCFSPSLSFVFCWQWCMQCCSTAQCYTSRIYHAYVSTLSRQTIELGRNLSVQLNNREFCNRVHIQLQCSSFSCSCPHIACSILTLGSPTETHHSAPRTLSLALTGAPATCMAAWYMFQMPPALPSIAMQHRKSIKLCHRTWAQLVSSFLTYSTPKSPPTTDVG